MAVNMAKLVIHVSLPECPFPTLTFTCYHSHENDDEYRNFEPTLIQLWNLIVTIGPSIRSFNVESAMQALLVLQQVRKVVRPSRFRDLIEFFKSFVVQNLSKSCPELWGTSVMVSHQQRWRAKAAVR